VIDLARLAQEYDAEIPRYRRLEALLVPGVTARLLEAGIAPTVSHRVKDYASLARKAIKKSWPDAMHRSPDLLGVRIIVPFTRLKDAVVDALKSSFTLTGDDNKVTKYGATALGYLGRHLQISYPDGHAPERALEGLQAELQLHTRAESAWADASHDLTYKAALALPESLERRVNRLTALVELFDNEMAGAQDDLTTLPGFPAARMLQVLERSFLPLALRDFDRELSVVVLTALLPAYEPAELETYERLIGAFVDARAERLKSVYGRWRADPYAHPLVLQPESIAIFERLERNETGIRDAWDQALPGSVLDAIAELWGVVLSRPGERD